MCTHTRLIKNPYSGKTIRVACGKCPACLQEKANRNANRIRFHSSPGELALFVTLTYNNDFVPYIRLSDLYTHPEVLNIYRGSIVIDIVNMFDFCYDDLYTGKDLLPLSHCEDTDKVGVLYYKDIQNFFKRLRQNLKRKFNYEFKISYFTCSEYGSVTLRPHFHIVLFCKASSYATLQSAISASWTFADRMRTEKFTEIAKDVSSYVASYVNGNLSLPNLLQIPAFRPSHSMSKNFGVRNDVFSLRSILQKVRENNLVFCKQTYKDDVPSIVEYPIPQYVISRYFPKFKGYNRVTDDKIQQLLLCPERLASYVYFLDYKLEYSKEDLHKFTVLIFHCVDRYAKEFNIGFEEASVSYPLDYVRTWNTYFCTLERFCHSSLSSIADYGDFYENVMDLFTYPPVVHSDLINYDIVWQLNPNARKDIVNKTASLNELYDKKDKSKKVVNCALAHYNI